MKIGDILEAKVEVVRNYGVWAAYRDFQILCDIGNDPTNTIDGISVGDSIKVEIIGIVGDAISGRRV